MKGSFLKDNIRSLLALIWSLGALSIFIIVLFKDIKSDDKTTFLIISGLNGLIGFLFGYYYAASKPPSDDLKKTDIKKDEQTG